jgi:SPP1 gp7 family putative phage head morphogenesis protein
MITQTQEEIDAEAERRREIALAVLLSLSKSSSKLRVGRQPAPEVIPQSQINAILDATAATRVEIGSFVSDIAKVTAADQVQAVLESLATALLAGTSFESWKTLATSGVADISLSAGQLQTALRTNIQTAYNAGRYTAQVANKYQQPILMYDAVNDSRTREAHAAMSGFMAPVDHPVWSVWYPPNGYNCRCSVISMTEAEAQARGYQPGATPPNVQPDPGFGFNAAARGGLQTVSHAARSAR